MPNVHHAAEYYVGEVASTLGVYPDSAGRERTKAVVSRAMRQGADQALDGPFGAILHAAISEDERAKLLAAITQASAQFGNARLKR